MSSPQTTRLTDSKPLDETALSSNAVTTPDEPPKATHEGSFRLFGVDVKCYRLENGQAIIEAESFHRLMDAMELCDADVIDHDEIRRYQNFMSTT